MEKIVLVGWDHGKDSRARAYEAFVTHAAPRLLEAGALRLSVCVADAASDVRSPSPFPLLGRTPTGIVNAWVESADCVEDLVEVLEHERLEVAAYRVSESIYCDYGDNQHAPPRTWPDGQRSPGITAVTFMERPRRLSREAWVARWHGRMSPISETIQPRTRYVRNLVLHPLTAGAPPFEGIVEEAWPSPRHVTNPFLFYGANNGRELVKNMTAIVRTVTSFLTLWRIQTVMMSEYFLVS